MEFSANMKLLNSHPCGVQVRVLTAGHANGSCGEIGRRDCPIPHEFQY